MHRSILLLTLLIIGCQGNEEESSVDNEYLGVIPSAPSPAPVDYILNFLNSTISAVNATHPETIPIEGSCAPENSSAEVFINSSIVETINCHNGSFTFDLQKSQLNEGNNQLRVKIIDQSVEATRTIVLDSIVPSISLITTAFINNSNVNSFTLSGTCDEDGVVNALLGAVSASGSCFNGSFNISEIDLRGESDGNINVQATIIDAAGNRSAIENIILIKDVVAPTVSLATQVNIHAANVNAYDISGTCQEESGPVVLSIGLLSFDTICFSGAFLFSGLDLFEALDSLNLALTISHSDVAGNTSIDSTFIIKDTLPPALSINSPGIINQASQLSYSISGTCSDSGLSLSGTIGPIPFTSLCQSGIWISSGLNLSFLADATYLISINALDSNGNSSGVITASVIKDTTQSLPTFTFINPIISYGNLGSFDLRVGELEVGDIVEIYRNSSCSESILSAVSLGQSHDFNLITTDEGIYSYYFIVTDLLSNSTGCLGPINFTEDQTAPSTPLSIVMSSPQNGESSADSTPIFTGTISTLEEGSQIKAYRDDLCSDFIGQATVNGGVYQLLGNLAIDGSDNGLNQFYMQTIDRAGNQSTCFDSDLSYTLEGSGLASLPKIAMVGNDSPSYLVSLEDGNNIIWIKKSDPNNPVDLGTLSAGEVIQIQDPLNINDKVDQGDRIESSAACYVVTEGFGTAPWASEAYSGRLFTSFQYRYGNNNPHIYVTAVLQDSFVQLKQDLDNDGDLDVVAFASVAQGETYRFDNNLIDGRSFQIISDQNINAYYVSSAGGAHDRDARVLTPAANEIVGFSFFVTSIQNNTSVSAHRNANGASFSNTINVNEHMDIGRALKANLADWATYISADRPVSMLQIADQDGTNATPSLPVTMMATHYAIARDADYVGMIALKETQVQVIRPDGSVRGTFDLSKNNGAHADAPHALSYTDGASIPAGTRFICSNPCFMIYDDEGPGADRDETLMMGYTP